MQCKAFRSGNANPDGFLPRDANRALWGKEGAARLTEMGKKQGIAIGRQLRERYARLLDGHYDPSSIVALSSSQSSSRDTMQAVLAGLVPATRELHTSWQPIPTTLNDPLLRIRATSCPKARRVWSSIEEGRLPSIRHALDRESRLLRYVARHTGWNDSLASMSRVADNLHNLALRGLSFPDWVNTPKLEGTDGNTIFAQITQFRDSREVACANYQPCRDIMAGYWLGHLAQTLQAKDEGASDELKLALYAADSDSLLSLMKLLDLDVNRVSASGGFLLELRDGFGGPEIRILQHSGRKFSPHQRRLRAGPTPAYCRVNGVNLGWCPLTKFLQDMTQKIILDTKRACQESVSFDSLDLPEEEEPELREQEFDVTSEAIIFGPDPRAIPVARPKPQFQVQRRRPAPPPPSLPLDPVLFDPLAGRNSRPPPRSQEVPKFPPFRPNSNSSPRQQPPPFFNTRAPQLPPAVVGDPWANFVTQAPGTEEILPNGFRSPGFQDRIRTVPLGQPDARISVRDVPGNEPAPSQLPRVRVPKPKLSSGPAQTRSAVDFGNPQWGPGFGPQSRPTPTPLPLDEQDKRQSFPVAPISSGSNAVNSQQLYPSVAKAEPASISVLFPDAKPQQQYPQLTNQLPPTPLAFPAGPAQEFGFPAQSQGSSAVSFPPNSPVSPEALNSFHHILVPKLKSLQPPQGNKVQGQANAFPQQGLPQPQRPPPSFRAPPAVPPTFRGGQGSPGFLPQALPSLHSGGRNGVGAPPTLQGTAFRQPPPTAARGPSQPPGIVQPLNSGLPCTDEAPQYCFVWARQGHCKNHPLVTIPKCQQTCGCCGCDHKRVVDLLYKGVFGRNAIPGAGSQGQATPNLQAAYAKLAQQQYERNVRQLIARYNQRTSPNTRHPQASFKESETELDRRIEESRRAGQPLRASQLSNAAFPATTANERPDKVSLVPPPPARRFGSPVLPPAPPPPSAFNPPALPLDQGPRNPDAFRLRTRTLPDIGSGLVAPPIPQSDFHLPSAVGALNANLVSGVRIPPLVPVTQRRHRTPIRRLDLRFSAEEPRRSFSAERLAVHDENKSEPVKSAPVLHLSELPGDGRRNGDLRRDAANSEASILPRISKTTSIRWRGSGDEERRQDSIAELKLGATPPTQLRTVFVVTRRPRIKTITFPLPTGVPDFTRPLLTPKPARFDWRRNTLAPDFTTIGVVTRAPRTTVETTTGTPTPTTGQPTDNRPTKRGLGPIAATTPRPSAAADMSMDDIRNVVKANPSLDTRIAGLGVVLENLLGNLKK